MALVVSLLIYLLFAVIVGLEGRDRRGGFIGTFVVSMLLTPLIAYILLYCFEETMPALPRKSAKALPAEVAMAAGPVVDTPVKAAAVKTAA